MIIIKNPLIFLYKIKHKHKFTNNQLEIVLGYFIEKNIEVAVYNDIREIINNYEINSVNKFYKLLKCRNKLEKKFNKLSYYYSNDYFWKLTMDDKINYLSEKSNLLNSIFDKNINIFICRLKELLDTDYKYEMIDDLIQRLLIIRNKFGLKLLKSMNVKLITISEIYTLSNNEIINYISEIYNKINNLIITIGKPIANIKIIEFEICNYKSHKYVKLNDNIINENNIEKEKKEENNNDNIEKKIL
jgi:hypothetical protein